MTQEPGPKKASLWTDFRRLWTWFWSRSWKVKGPALGAVALVLLIIIGAASGGSEDEPTQASADEPQATSTATAEPDGEDEPTNTPEPTDTPEPDPTDTPEPTVDAELAYRANILAINDFMAADMAAITDLLGNNDITDAQWRADVADKTRSMETNIARMRELDPPSARWNAFDERLNEALNLFDLAMVSLRQGVENFDTAKINDAATFLELGTQAYTEAAGLIP